MDKKEEGLIEKVNKLSLPATILIGCVILGGFYYMSQVSKQNSIEKQQRLEIQTKKEAGKNGLKASLMTLSGLGLNTILLLNSLKDWSFIKKCSKYTMRIPEQGSALR